MKPLSTTRTTMIAGTTVVVGIYLFLAFVGLFCVTAHAGHHGHVAHTSPLCSWACQANNSASLITLVTPILPILLFIALLDFSLRQVPLPDQIRLSSRGPPR
ncbi:MAG: hypothetical protein VST68_11040 [Nitrospirota bacterium]|nr:hypothetical protein [Nitrospirota bacterium]